VGDRAEQVGRIQSHCAVRCVRRRVRVVDDRPRYRDASLTLGTSYAVWVAVGAVLSVVYAMLTSEEAASLIKVVLIVGIIGCVVGLKVVSH
jgi:hypothetical protein